MREWIHLAQQENLGQVGSGNIRGVLLHAMIAVDADDGVCLGLVCGDVYTRGAKHVSVTPDSSAVSP